MNVRTASLLTALLFLATPLAFIPSAAAQNPGPFVDCVVDESSQNLAFEECADEAEGIIPSGCPPGTAGTFPECAPTVDPTVAAVLCSAEPVGPILVEEALGGDCPIAPPPAECGEDETEYPVVGCGPTIDPSGGGSEPSSSPCIVADSEPAADDVHDALCQVSGALASPFVSVAYDGDDDDDDRYDYAIFGIKDVSQAERPNGPAGDGCGVLTAPVAGPVVVPTGLDGAGTDCFDAMPTLFFLHVRIDLNPGVADPMSPVSADAIDGPLVILDLRRGNPIPVRMFADGNAIVLNALELQDPRKDPFRYYLVSDLDGDGEIDMTELACPASPTNPFGTISNPTNAAATCADPDADGDDRGRVNADGTRNDDGEGTQDSDPSTWDSDGDGQRDSTDPFPLDATNGDPDQDGILTFVELGLLPGSIDSPGNPYCAHAEGEASVLILAAPDDGCESPGVTDPFDSDTDDDGLLDGQETKDTTFMHGNPAHNHLVHCALACNGGYRSDPANPDTDNDGQLDGSPNGRDDRPADPVVQDLDNDGLWDNVEQMGTLEGYTSPDLSAQGGPGGATQASNQYCSGQTADGASITREAGKPLSGDCPEGDAGGVSSTSDTDSDNDGLSDYEEVSGMYSSRLDANDNPTCFRITGVESDPNNADTDDDGFTDFREICPGSGGGETNPADPASKPALGCAGTNIFIGCLTPGTPVSPCVNYLSETDPSVYEQAWRDCYGLIAEPPAGCNDPIFSDPTPCIAPPGGGPEPPCDVEADPFCAIGGEPEPPCDVTVDPLCVVGGSPGTPNPVAILLDPSCDFFSDPEDPDCQAQGTMPAQLDSRDLNDVDDDGIIYEPNNQVDLVEERLVYYDLDEVGEPAHAEAENNADLEGAGPGATLAIWNPTGLFAGRPGEVARLHLGDGGDEGTPTDLVVLEEGRRGDPDVVSCVYLLGTELKFVIQNAGGYDPHDLEEPCGTPTSWVDAFNENGIVELTDEDRNQVPDAVAIVDPSTCEGDFITGMIPDPTACEMGEPTPVGGIPEAGDPCELAPIPVVCGAQPDPVAEVCAVEPVGLPVCPDPCVEDPEAEGCEPNPCEEDPEAEGCEPPACDPTNPATAASCADPGAVCVVPIPVLCSEPGPTPADCGEDPDATNRVGPLTICLDGDGGPITRNYGAPGVYIEVFNVSITV